MRLDDALLDLAAEQRSCVADWQARFLGATSTEITRLKRSDRWVHLGEHVLVAPGVEIDDLVRTSAAVLDAGLGAALSHASSLALWGHPGFPLLPASVSQTSGKAHRPTSIGDLHDLVTVPERWVTTFRGIRVVKPELAAYQACGVMSPRRAARVFDWFWSHNLLSGRSGRVCLEDLAERGRNGTVVYRDIVTARGDDYVPPASGLESRVKELGEEAGLVLRRQVNVGGEHFDGRVDFLAADRPLVFEVQSELYHASLSNREADELRRKQLEADGFTVEELWDGDIWTRPDRIVAGMMSAYWRCAAKSHP